MTAESLPLYDFEDTRWSYMDAVGVLTLFQKTFPLPVPEPDGDNGADFLPASEVSNLVASGLAGLPKTKDADVLGGREQFLEVLEGVAEDGLDGLVVY